jgi:hypothetical protein
MPSVSSSKNLNNPALAAGIGDLLSPFFFFLLIFTPYVSTVVIFNSYLDY